MSARRPLLRWLLIAWLALAGSIAQAQVDPWPRPAERPWLEEPVAAHREGRERLLREVVALFERLYWDPEHLDWAAWATRFREEVVGAPDRPAFDAAVGRMIRAVGDDHSSWMGLPPAPGAPAAAPDRATSNGLGAQLAHVAGRGLVVERVFPGTAAAEVGLRRTDVITAVDGVELGGLGSLRAATEALTTALGRGTALLRLERGRRSLEVAVAPAPVDFGVVATRPYGTMLDETVALLHVPSFNEAGVGAAVHAAVRDLQAAGAGALVLDLRGNLGGRLIEAGLAVGVFLDGPWARASARGEVAWEARYEIVPGAAGPEGRVRLLEDAGGSIGEGRVADPVRFDGPVVVVVGSETASAAEIVAGALLTAGRARVVGERTQGNVEAVRSFALSDGSRVLVAIARMEGADGTRFDDGIVPQATARASVHDLARGVDPPVAEALRLLGNLPFTPGRWF